MFNKPASLQPISKGLFTMIAAALVFAGAPVDTMAGQSGASTIRVGRSCTCKDCITVESMSLDTYVKRCLPAEWYSTWHTESLKAGSVAVRSFAAWHVKNPINASYDICDSTCCQVYNTSQYASTDAAVNATANVYLVNIYGNIARSEYSAEANNSGCADGKTNYCISDALCAGAVNNGHGRGMCQWGSKRWADSGKLYPWIVTHYYNYQTTPYFMVTLAGTATATSTKVLDNTSVEFNASTSWILTSSSTDRYGADYRYRSTATTSDPATWTFSPGFNGNYEISVLWSAGTNRSSSAKYIFSDGTSVLKDQKVGGGLWQVLGTKNLTTGAKAFKLDSVAPTGSVVIADAIKFYGPL